ncbi:MAG: hypothetical protein IMY82_02165 [Chloroflexi bacterium]|nr:hypothetical protein [Chloroflexota bacterium]
MISLKNNVPRNLEFWDTQRGIIRSRKGGWKIGEGVFSHGYNLLEDFVGNKSYFQVMVLHATGRLVERSIADWMEAVYICMSWPDPRIWCNQIGALGGTINASIVASTAAGLMAGDSKLYGQKPLLKGVTFIQAALKQKKTGFTTLEIIEKECKKNRGNPSIMGYARPLAKGDERVEILKQYNKESSIVTGDHLRLANEIDQVMIEKYNESININGYASAIMSDFGFTPQETYQISTLLTASGIIACYLDANERPPESFLPLRCDDIDYQGPPPREVPDRE